RARQLGNSVQGGTAGRVSRVRTGVRPPRMDSLKVMWIALRDGAVRGLFWILLVCGLLLLAVGSFANVGDAWRDFLKTTGASILASGVFAALLKSLQFMGVFRAELAAQQQGLADD